MIEFWKLNTDAMFFSDVESYFHFASCPNNNLYSEQQLKKKTKNLRGSWLNTGTHVT